MAKIYTNQYEPLKIEEDPHSNEASPAYDFANSKMSFGQPQQHGHKRITSQASDNKSGGEILLEVPI